jgi:hypothetical protein
MSRPFSNETERIVVDDNGIGAEFGGWDTSWVHTPFAAHDKNWYSVTAYTEGLSSTNTIQLEYKLDDATDYTTHFEKFDSSPVQSLTLPAETTGKVLKLRFTKSSTDTDLTSYIVNFELRPDRRREFQFALKAQPAYLGIEGIMNDVDTEIYADILRDIDAQKWPVEMTTHNGDVYNVIFDDLQEVMITEKNVQRGYVFYIKAHESK